MNLRCRIVVALTAIAVLAPAADASALVSPKKTIWGPVTKDGVSQFRYYRDLKAGIYAYPLQWREVATRRPVDPTNPDDPAYAWPAELDQAQTEVDAASMRMMIEIYGTPRWANGGRARNYVPTNVKDFSDFAAAVARRYPNTRLFQIWGEPSRQDNFLPLTPERRGRPLNAEQRKAPRYYARMLDAAYGAIKAVNPAALIIGGNTFTTGDISPLNFIKNLRLPSGAAPRMDLYGHNPFSGRKPNLRKPPLRFGFADFSDLDTLTHWLDRFLKPRLPTHKTLRLFLSEFLIPTDHTNFEFNFWVSKKTQASWLKAALGIARRWSRIYSLGWFSLYDDEPNRRGDQVNRGLLDYRGNKKPAYFTFRRG